MFTPSDIKRRCGSCRGRSAHEPELVTSTAGPCRALATRPTTTAATQAWGEPSPHLTSPHGEPQAAAGAGRPFSSGTASSSSQPQPACHAERPQMLRATALLPGVHDLPDFFHQTASKSSTPAVAAAAVETADLPAHHWHFGCRHKVS